MKPVSVTFALLLGACTVPDVGPEITTASVLFRDTAAPFRPGLEREAMAEQRAAENAMIAAGEPYLELEGCESDTAQIDFAGCRLKNIADPRRGADASATEILDAFTVMENYFAALSGLANSSSSEAVRLQMQALLSALDQTKGSRFAALADLAERAGPRADGILATTGFLAERYRINALRRVVRKADPVIEEMTQIIAARLDLDGPLAERTEALLISREDMEAAAGGASAREARRTSDALEADFKAYDKAWRASAEYRFGLLRSLHGDLKDRLSGVGSAEEILQTLTEINRVLDAIEKKDV